MAHRLDLHPLPSGLVAVTGVIREFLADMADHETRTWVVADYEADARLPWRRHVVLSANHP